MLTKGGYRAWRDGCMKSKLELKKNENKKEREERLKLKTKNRRERGERERVSHEGEKGGGASKLEPWCCYIVFQPQSLQICFKSKPINKLNSNLDKIR